MEQEELEQILGVQLSYYQNNSFKLQGGNTYYQITAVEKKQDIKNYQLTIPFEEYKQ